MSMALPCLTFPQEQELSHGVPSIALQSVKHLHLKSAWELSLQSVSDQGQQDTLRNICEIRWLCQHCFGEHINVTRKEAGF
jgi:hypothetical protein